MQKKMIDVYLEVGKKKTFASALEWPGWSRSGRNEALALQTLCDYGARYAKMLRSSKLGFQPPVDTSVFKVVERLEGNATTDFGAPGLASMYDEGDMDERQLQQFLTLMEACLNALGEAAESAAGKELQKGPRGGGRDLDKIIQHVVNAQAAYLSRIGYKFQRPDGAALEEQLDRSRQAIREALAAAAHGERATQVPRGGRRWTPRYFVRRSAWHVLDHAWEIEDRIL